MIIDGMQCRGRCKLRYLGSGLRGEPERAGGLKVLIEGVVESLR